MTIIEKRREDTYNDLIEKLQRHGKCALIRPTGFGKTGILTRLLKNYNNVLFLYPAEVVVDTVKNFYGSGEIKNTTFMTYAKLIRLSEDDIESLGDVDLILCDECHRLGAEKTVDAMKYLLDSFPDAHLVGATATPDRMDLVDEISEFFDNIVVYEYTLHNAFQDKVLKKPFYTFCSYGTEDLSVVEKETRLEIEKCNSKDRDSSLTLLRARLIEISNLRRIDKIIRDTCNKYVKDTSYMKFIVFFADFAHISKKGNSVKSWFEKAYPDHTVNMLKITSENKVTTENVHKLNDLGYQQNHIDLIFCCEMLNMGYHVDSLTGIAMYRGTESGIIFSQQLGRALSSGSANACVVFDFVDNIHRASMYDVLGKKSKWVEQRQKRREFLLKKQETGTLTEMEEKELKILLRPLDSNRWWTHANDLTPEDLIATGHMATYRELIAKTVAEPIAMRCRQAWARWKEQGGDDSIMTREAILSKIPPKFVPLEPFCRLKCVTIEQVLKEMGL